MWSLRPPSLAVAASVSGINATPRGLAHAFLLLCRSSKQSVQDKRSLSLEGDVLAEALQRYLPYLEALSQAAVPDVLPGLKPDRPPAQVTLRAPLWSGVCLPLLGASSGHTQGTFPMAVASLGFSPVSRASGGWGGLGRDRVRLHPFGRTCAYHLDPGPGCGVHCEAGQQEVGGHRVSSHPGCPRLP